MCAITRFTTVTLVSISSLIWLTVNTNSIVITENLGGKISKLIFKGIKREVTANTHYKQEKTCEQLKLIRQIDSFVEMTNESMIDNN